MNKTCLYEHHKALGAVMGPFAGYHMPLRYAGVRPEVEAVRTGAGLFDVSHMGEILVEGVDAVMAVDYLLTNDFMAAPMGKAVYSPMCDDEGGIIDDLIAYKLNEFTVLLCVNAANKEEDARWIEAKTAFFNVSFSDASDIFSLLALQGPRARAIAEAVGLVVPKGTYEAVELGPTGATIVATTGYTGEDGLEVFAFREEIIRLWEALVEQGAVPCGLAARDTLRIEAGYPLYGCELSRETTPWEAGLSWTVKFSGRDFIGQEALGHREARFRVLGLSLDKGIPRAGYLVVDSAGREIGRVTSGTYSPSLGRGIALASVEKKNLPEDGVFRVKIRDKLFEARRQDGGFVKRGDK